MEPAPVPPSGNEVSAIAPDTPVRLDVFVAALCPPLDRITAGSWIRAGHVTVGDRLLKPSMHLRPGDVVAVRPPRPLASEALPEDLPLAILYRDEHMVVVNKPAGMATHPGPGWWSGSAVNALLHHITTWQAINGIVTPGIVHRLDRDTGGLLIFANGPSALNALLAAMRERRVSRRYMALVHGRLEGSGTVDQPLDRDPSSLERVIVTEAGKRAVTHWRAIATTDDYSLLDVTLETGRTHQVRVHLAWLGHPIVNDLWYGGLPVSDSLGMRLFAYSLALRHPLSGAHLQFFATPSWIDLLNVH